MAGARAPRWVRWGDARASACYAGAMDEPLGQWTQARPCEACPYRRDAPCGFWAPEEFLRLLASERDNVDTLWGCHLNPSRPPSEGEPCAGWLADQKRRRLPSAALRTALVEIPEARRLFARIDEQDPGLYASLEEMVLANLRRRFPEHSRKARRLRLKLAGG